MTARGGGHDIILAGVPRSGTTLVCHLLNKLPDIVALNEPMHAPTLAAAGPHGACDVIADFFATQRASLLAEHRAISQTVDDAVPTNGLGGIDPMTGRRRSLFNSTVLRVGDKPLDGPFDLCIKHPVMFSVLLPELTGRFSCFAIVRNPLATLQSWQTTGLAHSAGHAPAAEALSPSLARALAAEPDRLERQIFILDHFFAIYSKHAADHILRYEDIIASGGAELGRIAASAGRLREELTSLNHNALYDKAQWWRLGERLLARNGAWQTHYPPKEIEALMLAAGAVRC